MQACRSPSGHRGPVTHHSFLITYFASSLSVERAGKETKGLEQGGDTLLFIVAVPTHGCQESDGGAPYRVPDGAAFSAGPGLHLHPGTGVSALLTSGALTSFPGTGAEFSQPRPVGEERRWNWNRRAQPHLPAPPAVKAPKIGGRGAAARPRFQVCRRPVTGALGKCLS